LSKTSLLQGQLSGLHSCRPNFEVRKTVSLDVASEVTDFPLKLLEQHVTSIQHRQHFSWKNGALKRICWLRRVSATFNC